MAFDPLGFGLGLFGDLFTGGVNAQMQAEENEKNRQFQREMYQQQLADSRENWRMMNEYNLPSNQMKRLAEANLNPNLVYGSGGVTGTTSLPSSPSASAPNQSAPQLKDLQLAQNYYAAKRFQQEYELLDANVDKSRAEAENIRTDAALKASQTGLNNLEYYVQSQIQEYRISEWHNKLWRQQFENDNAAILGIRQAEANISKTIAETMQLGFVHNLTKAQISSVLKDVEVKNATIQKIMADTQVSYAAAENIYDEIISRAISDELGVLKQTINPFGTGAVGSALNGVYNITYSDGQIYDSVNNALGRLRGTAANRENARRNAYPVRGRVPVTGKRFTGKAPSGYRRFKR